MHSPSGTNQALAPGIVPYAIATAVAVSRQLFALSREHCRRRARRYHWCNMARRHTTAGIQPVLQALRCTGTTESTGWVKPRWDFAQDTFDVLHATMIRWPHTKVYTVQRTGIGSYLKSTFQIEQGNVSKTHQVTAQLQHCKIDSTTRQQVSQTGVYIPDEGRSVDWQLLLCRVACLAIFFLAQCGCDMLR